MGATAGARAVIYSSHMPEATGTWTSRGPSWAAIASRSASVSSSRPDTCAPHAVAAGHRGDVEPGQVEPRRAGDLLERGEPLEDHVLVVAQDQERDRQLVGAAVHSAVIPYWAEPSPSTQTTGRSRLASWTPTAAEIPKPRPPLAQK